MTRIREVALFTALAAASHPACAADIEFWHGNSGTVAEAIAGACDAFNSAQDSHRVTCIAEGGYEAVMQKAIAAYRTGDHPALIQFFDVGTLDLMVSDAALPVEDLMPEVDWSDYIGGVRSYYATEDGKLLSQPYNSSTLVFYGNMESLAGVGVSELPETWEAVVETSRKLKDAGQDCPFGTDEHPWLMLEQFAARHGVPIATEQNGYEGLGAVYTFNEGLIADHLKNLQAWHDEGLVRLNRDLATGKYFPAFLAGDCAMVEASSGGYADAAAALGDKLGLGLAPVYEGVERHNTLVGGASIWVMKNHDPEEIEAAKAFLNFLRSNEQQIEFTRRTGYLPVTQSAMDKIDELGLSDDPAFATVGVGVRSLGQPGDENSRGIRLGFYLQFRNVFREETQKAFNGEQSMQAALDNSVERGNALLRRFEQTYAGAQAQ